MIGSDYLRLTGLASGMDTESIVKKLMKAERIPVDQMKQKQQLLTWQQSDMRDINTKLAALKDAAFNLTLSGTFSTPSASSSDPTKVTATASSGAANGTYTVGVTSLASSAFVASTAATGAATVTGTTLNQKFGLTGTQTFNITVNGVTKTLSVDPSTATIQDVVSLINGAGLGANASYDANLDRFFVSTLNTGASQSISLSDAAGSSLLTKLKINGATATGTNASFTVNGTAMSSATNTFGINGVTMNLNGITTSNVTVTVSQNVDTLMTKLKDFIKTYNDTLDLINGKLSEQRYRDFPPLTDDQKAAMKDSEITKWEAKAKSGLLRGNFTLRSISSDMQNAVITPVVGTNPSFQQLSQIGISTGPYTDKGKLVITDEAKLRNALSQNPTDVVNLFTRQDTTTAGHGVGVKLTNVLTSAITRMAAEAGKATDVVDTSYLGTQISGLNTRISDWNRKLIDIENRYWRQFTQMEQAIGKMNSQSSWLSQQLGGLAK